VMTCTEERQARNERRSDEGRASPSKRAGGEQESRVGGPRWPDNHDLQQQRRH
jgi:hypothetical protein